MRNKYRERNQQQRSGEESIPVIVKCATVRLPLSTAGQFPQSTVTRALALLSFPLSPSPGLPPPPQPTNYVTSSTTTSGLALIHMHNQCIILASPTASFTNAHVRTNALTPRLMWFSKQILGQQYIATYTGLTRNVQSQGTYKCSEAQA